MQFGPNEEQEMIVRTVRRFVEEEIYLHEEAVERSGTVPPELAESLKARNPQCRLDIRRVDSVAGTS